ncbi:MAG TPA: hypothetical protein VEA39_07685, partial [Methylophilaceae bacterium]|nr:hypothetical protein [Methylophilaceae bacterium]
MSSSLKRGICLGVFMAFVMSSPYAMAEPAVEIPETEQINSEAEALPIEGKEALAAPIEMGAPEEVLVAPATSNAATAVPVTAPEVPALEPAPIS